MSCVKTKAKTPEGILRAAARYIRKHGWYQGDLVDDETGAVCLYGAVYAVVTGSPDTYSSSASIVGDLLRQRTGVHYPDEWNDEAGRTEAEVLAVLEGKA